MEDETDLEPASLNAASLDRMLGLYRGQAAACRTENQLNRLHIALDNYLTPTEVRHLNQAFAADHSDSLSRRWIARLAALLPVNRARPVEFSRGEIFRGVTRYASAEGSPEGKTLILGFGGFFHRLMVPTAWLLDCLDPRLFDVVILRDFRRAFFTTGVSPSGGTFFDLLADLLTRVDPQEYRRSLALGTSGGGIPAVLTAMALGLDRGVSLCALEFDLYVAKVAASGQDFDRYAAVLASRPQPFPEMVLCFGGDNDADRVATIGLHDRVPSRLLEIPGCPEHAVLAWALMQHTLPALLAELFGQALEIDE